MPATHGGRAPGSASAADRADRAVHAAGPAPSLLPTEALRAVLLRPSFVAAQSGGLLFLVARDHFQAPPWLKALVAGAFFFGLLCSPWALGLASRAGLSAERALSLATLGAALGLTGAALSSSAAGYSVGVLLGVSLSACTAPMITAIWQAQVPAALRGRRYALVTSLAGGAGVLAALAWAQWLGRTVDGYRPVLLAVALTLVASSLVAWRLPRTALGPTPASSLGLLSLLWKEPRFGLVNLGWTLMGFGNLAAMPMRTEFLRGAGGIDFGYGAREVLLLVTVLPQAVALVATLVWGRLFDRYGFFGLRLSVNSCFIVSLLLFFTPWLPAQVASGILLGLGFGGEQLVWGLWVTEFAPPERTADYMAVHTFLTGVRGLAGPLTAYALLGRIPVLGIAYGAAGSILLSLLLFAWLARGGLAPRPAAA